MPRPARFTDDDVLDAARTAVVEHGPGATITQVAAALGGPVGSIYHRFGSREEVLARLWLRSIRRFHATLPRRGEDAQQTLVANARHVVAYCREHPDEARAMQLHRQDRLVADTRLPADLREEIAHVNDDLEASTRELAADRYGRCTAEEVLRIVVATRVLPYGLVRPWLGTGTPVPGWLEEAAGAAAAAVLDQAAATP